MTLAQPSSRALRAHPLAITPSRLGTLSLLACPCGLVIVEAPRALDTRCHRCGRVLVEGVVLA